MTDENIRNKIQIKFVKYLSRMKNSFLPLLFLRSVYMNFFLHLRVVQLHINTNCNYNCPYCYVDTKIKDVLDTKEWIKVINEAKQLRVTDIELLGGEPFLYKDFYYLLTYIAKQKMDITIYTNGSLINKRWLENLSYLPIKRLIIKYDYNNSTYKKHTRTKISLNKIKDVIKQCAEKNLTVMTLTTLTKYNVNNAKDIIESSLKLGAYPLFERFLPIKNVKINKELQVRKEDYNKAIRLIKKSYSNVQNIIHTKSYIQGNFCLCFSNLISILPDGSCLPCQFWPISLRLGNIKDSSLRNIWNVYKKKRKEWNKLPKECYSCKYKKICNGGCKTHSYLIFGNLNKKDPFCNGFPPLYGLCGFYMNPELFPKTLDNKAENENLTY